SISTVSTVVDIGSRFHLFQRTGSSGGTSCILASSMLQDCDYDYFYEEDKIVLGCPQTTPSMNIFQH
uniref:Uncharacterized protein n=1 Tax=Anopheles atroparvus TaxID=41427 RepID=A0AAG5DXD0_ANOAO